MNMLGLLILLCSLYQVAPPPPQTAAPPCAAAQLLVQMKAVRPYLRLSPPYEAFEQPFDYNQRQGLPADDVQRLYEAEAWRKTRRQAIEQFNQTLVRCSEAQ